MNLKQNDELDMCRKSASDLSIHPQELALSHAFKGESAQ
jgi:hypothetical protein